VRFAQEATLKKMLLVFCWSAMLILIALPLRAQNGCVDSPEDPTVVLALVSGAGVLAARLWRWRGKH
jgi:XrtJ-associated TM-motif-TM protein